MKESEIKVAVAEAKVENVFIGKKYEKNISEDGKCGTARSGKLW